MKTYEEMINFVVKECTQGAANLRYAKWTAYIILGEAYSKTPDEVCADINSGIESFEKGEKDRRRAESRASNEARRIANLAKKQTI